MQIDHDFLGPRFFHARSSKDIAVSPCLQDRSLQASVNVPTTIDVSHLTQGVSFVCHIQHANRTGSPTVEFRENVAILCAANFPPSACSSNESRRRRLHIINRSLSPSRFRQTAFDCTGNKIYITSFIAMHTDRHTLIHWIYDLFFFL